MDRYGRTELHYVTVDRPANIHESEIDRLVNEGFDINLQDNDGWCALHFAAQEQSATAVKKLISLGAEIDVKDSNGNTPLMEAVFNSDENGEIITILLSAGASPTKENKHSVTPVGLAEIIDNFDLLQYFEK